MPDLEIIDAHHHFWDLNKNYYPWLADHEDKNFFLGDYSNLRRNYLPADYRSDASDFNIIATVHVEAEWDRTDQVGETAWLQDLNSKYDLPNAIVGHVWLAADNCEEILLRHRRYQLFRGVRSKPIISQTPDGEKPMGAGSMHDQAWKNGLSLLDKLNLRYDLRVPYWHLYEAADAVGRLPNLPVVLNHTGFPWDRSSSGLSEWRQALTAIAQCPNVFLKLSELGLKDADWTVDSNRNVVLEAINIFGVDRCMWASNFPVAGLRVSYADQLRGMLSILNDFPIEDIHKIFKNNAATFYDISVLTEK